MLTLGEQVLVDWHVVADGVVGLPAAEQRESWSQLKLDASLALGLSQIRGRDVANLVAVVDISGKCWQVGLEGLD